MGGIFSSTPNTPKKTESTFVIQCNETLKACNTSLEKCKGNNKGESSISNIDSLEETLDQCQTGKTPKSSSIGNTLLIIFSFITFLSIIYNLYNFYKLFKSNSSNKSGENDNDSGEEVSY